MSINNIINFDTAGKENEELLKENFDRFKTEASRSINIKNYSSIHTNLLPLITNLQVISSKDQLSSHRGFIIMRRNSSDISRS